MNSCSYFCGARDFQVLKFGPNSTKFFAVGDPEKGHCNTNDAKEIVRKRRLSMERTFPKNIPSITPETTDPSLDRLLFPARHFSHPDEVVGDRTLDTQEKRAILASWASDACAVESMPALRKPPGAPCPVTFDAVMDALRRLDDSRAEVGCDLEEGRARERPQRLDA